MLKQVQHDEFLKLPAKTVTLNSFQGPFLGSAPSQKSAL